MRFYLPDWKQSLLLVLIFFVGSMVAGIFALAGMELTSPVYVVSMAFPLAWAYFASRGNQKRGLGFVPLDEPRTGRLKSIFPIILVAFFATPFLGVLIEPLSNLFPMPDWLEAAFERMFDTSRPVDMVIYLQMPTPIS